MSVSQRMTSSRPYLIRALYDWIVDNDLTPYLLVDADHAELQAPLEYVDNGRLVLNISPRAVRDLDLGMEAVFFNGRFGGEPRDVWVPTPAISAIYARENGQGMLFSDSDDAPPPSGGGTSPEGGGSDESDSRPHLRVVK